LIEEQPAILFFALYGAWFMERFFIFIAYALALENRHQY
jgi:hypothetical protein